MPGIIKDHPTGKRKRRRRCRLRLREACPLAYSFRIWCKMSSESPCLLSSAAAILLFAVRQKKVNHSLLPLLLLPATFAIVSMAVEVLHSHFHCPGVDAAVCLENHPVSHKLHSLSIFTKVSRFLSLFSSPRSQVFLFLLPWFLYGVKCFYRSHNSICIRQLEQGISRGSCSAIACSPLWHNQIKSISCNYLGLHFFFRVI